MTAAHATAATDADDALVTVPELATRLRCSRAWIYVRLNAGVIEGVRLGDAWRIRQTVADHIAAHGLPTVPRSRT